MSSLYPLTPTISAGEFLIWPIMTQLVIAGNGGNSLTQEPMNFRFQRKGVLRTAMLSFYADHLLGHQIIKQYQPVVERLWIGHTCRISSLSMLLVQTQLTDWKVLVLYLCQLAVKGRNAIAVIPLHWDSVKEGQGAVLVSSTNSKCCNPVGKFEENCSSKASHTSFPRVSE